MQNTTPKNALNLNALVNLPQKKELLGYLLNKLCENRDENTKKAIEELFELHKTSKGFNPVVLTKVRMRRIKSGDFRNLLVDLNNSLNSIYNSFEYKHILSQTEVCYENLLTRFLSIQKQMEIGYTHELEFEINHLKIDLIAAKQFELLLSLNRMVRKFYQNQLLLSRLPEIQNEYSLLLNVINDSMESEYAYNAFSEMLS